MTGATLKIVSGILTAASLILTALSGWVDKQQLKEELKAELKEELAEQEDEEES